MCPIKAIDRHGVFEPLEPVNNLHEERRVLLSFECTEKKTVQTWLQQVREFHSTIINRHGFLPESTSGIAADRSAER
jgi:hypothetical protein